MNVKYCWLRGGGAHPLTISVSPRREGRPAIYEGRWMRWRAECRQVPCHGCCYIELPHLWLPRGTDQTPAPQWFSLKAESLVKQEAVFGVRTRAKRANDRLPAPSGCLRTERHLLSCGLRLV